MTARIIQFSPARRPAPTAQTANSAPGYVQPRRGEFSPDTDTRGWVPDEVPDEVPDTLTAPTPTELTQAELWWKGCITTADLVFICGSQVRAGRAIDATAAPAVVALGGVAP